MRQEKILEKEKSPKRAHDYRQYKEALSTVNTMHQSYVETCISGSWNTAPIMHGTLHQIWRNTHGAMCRVLWISRANIPLSSSSKTNLALMLLALLSHFLSQPD